jgi:hypothetical protein
MSRPNSFSRISRSTQNARAQPPQRYASRECPGVTHSTESPVVSVRVHTFEKTGFSESQIPRLDVVLESCCLLHPSATESHADTSHL